MMPLMTLTQTQKNPRHEIHLFSYKLDRKHYIQKYSSLDITCFMESFGNWCVEMSG